MSKIEWTDKTWNPVTGCTKVSQGCKNCYAETFYERFNGKGSFKNVICHEDRLVMPLGWKKPTMVFVNSMSDLFHEDVPFEFINRVFDTITACPDHTFQVLTKRAKRMRDFYIWFRDKYGYALPDNAWLGVSVENQQAMEERIPYLIQMDVDVKFLSCEPLLGPVQIPIDCNDGSSFIDWVICGGESGHKARPMHPDWARSPRDQCKAANVSFFFKQWGQYQVETNWYGKNDIWMDETGNIHHQQPRQMACYGMHVVAMNKVGKKKAGRLLDGVEHNDMPGV
jgi:protein gp37